MKKQARVLAILLMVLMLLPGGAMGGFALSGSAPESASVEEHQPESADIGAYQTKDADVSAEQGAESAETPDGSPEDSEHEEKADAREDRDKTDGDKDASGSGDPASTAAKESADSKAGTLEYKTDDYTVTLEYGNKAGIPEGTALEVREILSDSKDKKEQKEYIEYFDKSLEQLRSEQGGDSIATLGFAHFYDITLIADGREIEPESDVKVTFTYNKDARESVDSEANKASGRKTEDAVKVVHLTESGKTGELEAAAVDSKDTDLTVEKKELAETAFTTDSFSVYGIVYTVDFEYEGHTFSIAGESEILLSGVFERLHIEEDVKDVQEVTFTDPELIKVETVDEGDWKLTSLKPFDTTETLTVRLPEKIIEITVTDAQNGNTFTLYRTRENTNERFRTRVYASRAGVTATQVGNQDTALHHNDTYGWMDFETVLSQYYSDYAQPRYSVILAQDSTNRIDLCAIGFAESRVSGVFHGTFGLYTQQGATGQRANGSAAEYDLDITLNDNSLPVQIYVDGVPQNPENFVNTDIDKTQYTAEELAAALGYQGYVVSSSTIGGTDVGSVSVSEMTGQSLAGNTFGIGRTSVTLVYGLAWINYQFNDGFNYTYNKAYQWTYSGGNVGDTPYEIRLVSPICKIVDDSGEHPFETLNAAVNYARNGFNKGGTMSSTNPATIEMLVDYVIPQADKVTLNQAKDNIVITTAATSGGQYNFTPTFNSTQGRRSDDSSEIAILARGWDGGSTDAQSLFQINNGSAILTTQNITFDGSYESTQHTGRAIHVSSGSLTVKDGSTFRNFFTPNVGGAIYSAQVKNTKIQGSKPDKILFENCRATGSGSDYDGGGAIAFIQGTKDAGLVEGAKFVDCYTDACGGAIYVRTSSGASSFIVTNCEFDGHEDLNNIAANRVNAKWGGAIYIWDGWFALSNCKFTDCTATEDGGAVSVHSGGGDKVEYIENCTFKGHDTLPADTINAKTGGAVGLTTVGNGTDLIRNVTVTDCLTSGVGGGFYVNCALRKLEGEINFSNCSTTNGHGGGMYINTLQANAINEATHQTQLIFDNCHAGGGNSNGGGICFGSTPGPTTFTGAVFTDCSAGSNGGSIYLPGSNGKIFAFDSCEFNGHNDDLPGTGANVKANAKNGGAIYIYDGSPEFEGCNFTNLTVTGNGGAICMDGGGSDHITLTKCNINGHQNLDPNIKNASIGGGIWINADNGTTLNDVTISNCWTSGNGGGIYDVDPFTGTSGTVLFEDCYTTGGSGGGAFFNSTATFGKDGTDGSNTVTFKNCHDDSTSTSNGGGGAFFNSTVTLNGDTVLNFDSCHAASYGGGAWFNAATTLNNGTINFNDCYAAKRGGGAYFANSVTLDKKQGANNSTVNFNNCHTDSSGTSDGGGGAWFNGACTHKINADLNFNSCYTAANGGAAYFYSTYTLNSDARLAIDSCYAAINGGGAYFNNTATLGGTATFTTCHADTSGTSNGGGAYFNGTCTLNSGASLAIDSCYAAINGGGAYFKAKEENKINGSLSFEECYTTGGNGGGAYFNDVVSTTNGSISFKDCNAATNGGGAYFNNTATLGSTATFAKCHADTSGTSNGGGAYFNKTATLKESVSFTDCYTGAKGGAMYFNDTNNSMTGVTVNGHADLPTGTDNAQLGGALYLASGKTLTIKDGSITNCSASDTDIGGAVNAGGSGCKLFFEGKAYVFGNPATSTAIGDQRNVVLDYDTNTVIQTTTAGLSSDAQIGVYVTGNNPTTSTSDQFYKHGRLGAPYGTYGKDGDYKYFVNDRLSSGGALVRGVAKKASDRTNIMYWAIDHVPAPTDVDSSYLPYIFVLLAGLVLAATAVCVKRRRSAEE